MVTDKYQEKIQVMQCMINRLFEIIYILLDKKTVTLRQSLNALNGSAVAPVLRILTGIL